MHTELDKITQTLRRIGARLTLKEVEPEFAEVFALVNQLEKIARGGPGDVVVTTDKKGRCVAVTRQDREHRILSVIWEAQPKAHDGAA